MAIASKIRTRADIYDIVVTAADITAGYVTLPFVPQDLTKIVLDIIGGVPQVINVDFIVAADKLVYSNLGMQVVLSEGTTLRITYYNN